MLNRTILIRNIEFDDLFEIFLVSAVAAILGIRLYLKLTGYPQLGGGGFHIAHMLWGGLLMLATIIILLSFLNDGAKRLAAITGGVGFGAFIDELGKFITSDNNYFFQPTFALIYVCFVLLYLAFRALQYRGFTPDEYLINSLELVKEAVVHGLDQHELHRALTYLGRSDPQNRVTALLHQLYHELDATPPPHPDVLSRARFAVQRLYSHLTRHPWFTATVIVIFLGQALLSLLVDVIFVAGGALLLLMRSWGAPLPAPQLNWGLYDVLTLLSGAAAGGLVLMGAAHMPSCRIRAYHLFKQSLLVSIFVGQVFTFYSYQMGAAVELLFNILFLVALNYMIEQEQRKAKEAAKERELPAPVPGAYPQARSWPLQLDSQDRPSWASSASAASGPQDPRS